MPGSLQTMAVQYESATSVTNHGDSKSTADKQTRYRSFFANIDAEHINSCEVEEFKKQVEGRSFNRVSRYPKTKQVFCQGCQYPVCPSQSTPKPKVVCGMCKAEKERRRQQRKERRRAAYRASYAPPEYNIKSVFDFPHIRENCVCNKHFNDEKN